MIIKGLLWVGVNLKLLLLQLQLRLDGLQKLLVLLQVVLGALVSFEVLINDGHASLLGGHHHAFFGKHVMLNVISMIISFKEEAVVLK